MADREYWIQLEVVPLWNMAPSVDRMTGKTYTDRAKIKRNVLIYRQYDRNWRVPVDLKVNLAERVFILSQ